MVKIVSPWLTLVASYLETPHRGFDDDDGGEQCEVVWR